MLGSRIFDSAIAVLRSDAGSGPVYTALDGGSTPMPDLDEATLVLLAGASGGGAVTINNLDRLNELLRANDVACGGASCPLVVRGLIDSIFSPSLETLDFSTSVLCDAGICSYAALQQRSLDGGEAAFTGERSDSSCWTWHQANSPSTSYACADHGHVVRHHLTTPFFMRMGQNDSNIGPSMAEMNFTVPGQGLLDATRFAAQVRSDLNALSSIKTTAHEGAAIPIVPGAFGPTCAKHETLGDTPNTFNAVIGDGGVGMTMFDVLGNWMQNASPTSLVTAPPLVDFCPP